MFSFRQELGSTLVSVGPSGIKLDDEIADIDLKNFKIKKQCNETQCWVYSSPHF